MVTCGYCKRPLRRPFDEYTDFGSAAMVEPPEPVFLCRSCSKRTENAMVKRQSAWLPWRWGKCHRNAVARLGWVIAGAEHAAWAEAFPPGRVPADYHLWETPK